MKGNQMSTTSLTSLIANAGLGDDANAVLDGTIDDLGPAIQAGLGDIDIDDIETSEAVLLTLLIDDSSSIDYTNNAQEVRDGHNLIIDALRGSKQSAAVLVSCRLLNRDVLYPYVTLDNAPMLDSSNYHPSGATPLYDQSVVTLAAVAAKMTEFENGGIAARAVTAIITDGADVGSRRQTEGSVKKVIDGMLRTEQHIITGVGIDDGGYTDFRRVFGAMGIRDEWILTPGNSSSEIRKAFQTISQSAVRASQTAATFSQVAMGGFGS